MSVFLQQSSAGTNASFLRRFGLEGTSGMAGNSFKKLNLIIKLGFMTKRTSGPLTLPFLPKHTHVGANSAKNLLYHYLLFSPIWGGPPFKSFRCHIPAEVTWHNTENLPAQLNLRHRCRSWNKTVFWRRGQKEACETNKGTVPKGFSTLKNIFLLTWQSFPGRGSLIMDKSSEVVICWHFK